MGERKNLNRYIEETDKKQYDFVLKKHFSVYF